MVLSKEKERNKNETKHEKDNQGNDATITFLITVSPEIPFRKNAVCHSQFNPKRVQDIQKYLVSSVTISLTYYHAPHRAEE